MSTGKKQHKASKKAHTECFTDLLDDGAGIDDIAMNEANKRMRELSQRFAKLGEWGIVSKIPASQPTLRKTMTDLHAVLSKWNGDNTDPALVTSLTSDVRRLELWAEDFDKTIKAATPFVSPGVPKTSFDIESATAALNTATATTNTANEVVETAKEALAAASNAIVTTSKKTPWQVWLGGGLLVFGLIARELRKSTEAAKGVLEVNEARKAGNEARNARV